MPRGHRYDRQYCSETCRALAVGDRRRARLEREQWEAEHPEQAAAEQEEFQRWQEGLVALAAAAAVGKPERSEHVARLQARAERCAFRKWHPDLTSESRGYWTACDKPFAPGEVIYRRADHGLSHGTVLPFCAEHRCGQSDGFHNRDAPPGQYYPACRCPDDEHGVRHWLKPEPCAYCGRLVSNDRESADPKRFTQAWHYWRKNGSKVVRTFCSEDCRRAVFDILAKAKRLAARADARAGRKCEDCGETLDADRSDARYCSPACRQRAYRRRRLSGPPAG
jgi:hypothetical protein